MIQLPPYLVRLRDRLRESEPGRWQWFASRRWAEEHAAAVKLELLQATYRMEEAGHPKLYGAARKAAAELGLEVPITFYQAQEGRGLNAFIRYVPGEAHIVLSGPVLANFADAELVALIGHELAHYFLWSLDGGSYRMADEVIEAIALHDGAPPCYLESAERARRYAEIYADRGAYRACGDLHAVIACLVKIETGLTDVDPVAYARQAEEIFSRTAASSEAPTHPETFIRARALSIWQEGRADVEGVVAGMVQGAMDLDALDLLDQLELTGHTRSLLARVLAPAWFRSEPVLAHARSFFPDLDPGAPAGALDPSPFHDSVKQYLAYVLLDFAVVDEGAGEAGLAHAWTVADSLGLAEAFEKVAREELKLTKRAVDDVRKQAPELLRKAAEQAVQAEAPARGRA